MRSATASETAPAPAWKRSGPRSSLERHRLSSHEPNRGVALAGALVLVIVLVAGIGLIQFLVDQPYRQAAIRLVAAAVLLVAVIRIRAFVRASLGRPSAWDAERSGGAPWVPPSSSDLTLEQLRAEI